MLFIVDFDGTLSPQDTVDGLLERFADPQWHEVERAWLADEIDAIECMSQQLRLVRVGRGALEDYFAHIAVDPTFDAFCRYVEDFASVAIVSDGLKDAITTALEHHGLRGVPVFANHTQFTADGIEISFPHRDAQCRSGNGVCKCAVARTLARGHQVQTVLVGDGKSDTCLARSADVVFAKDRLADMCEREAIAYHPFEDFGDVLATVQGWALSPVPSAASLS